MEMEIICTATRNVEVTRYYVDAGGLGLWMDICGDTIVDSVFKPGTFSEGDLYRFIIDQQQTAVSE